MTENYDVVVVGARAAGASTAMLLARKGLSVLAVDRGAYGSDTLSTHTLARAGVVQLSRWGLLDRIRTAGTPVANTVAFHYGPETVTLGVPARGDVDGLYSPRRTLLDATLVDAARAEGAHVRHGVSLVAVTCDDHGRVDGVVVDAGAGPEQIACRYLVGADGIRSKVARQVGAELLHRDRAGSTSTYTYWEGFPDDAIVNYYDRTHVVGVIPTNDGAAVVWAGLSAADFARAGRGRISAVHAAQVAEVPELAEALSRGRRVGGYRAFAGEPGFLKQAWGPGWVLVGDAGYFKDPVTAHGITDAFIGAELVAEALAAVIIDGARPADALGHYQSVRGGMAAAMMPPAAAVAGFTGDLAAIKAAFVEMSRAMRDEQRLIEAGLAPPLVPA